MSAYIYQTLLQQADVSDNPNVFSETLNSTICSQKQFGLQIFAEIAHSGALANAPVTLAMTAYLGREIEFGLVADTFRFPWINDTMAITATCHPFAGIAHHS